VTGISNQNPNGTFRELEYPGTTPRDMEPFLLDRRDYLRIMTTLACAGLGGGAWSGDVPVGYYISRETWPHNVRPGEGVVKVKATSSVLTALQGGIVWPPSQLMDISIRRLEPPHFSRSVGGVFALLACSFPHKSRTTPRTTGVSLAITIEKVIVNRF